jgi:hypothetical protein
MKRLALANMRTMLRELRKDREAAAREARLAHENAELAALLKKAKLERKK